jgi:putative CocE/NonD family hydrolase
LEAKSRHTTMPLPRLPVIALGLVASVCIASVNIAAAGPTVAVSPGATIAVGAPLTSTLFPGVTCQKIRVPMRDGTRLQTELYLPTKAGRYPVIMERTPYADTTHNVVESCFNVNIYNVAAIIAFAQAGYAGVSQDARGTYTSDGTFHAMTQEAQDGYDAIEWAAKQSWSTGKVGTWGGSYVGLTQWQPAIHTPPHLAAIAPTFTASDYHDHWTYVNGVFDLWFAQSWLAGSFVPDQIFREGRALGYTPAQITTAETNWTTLLNANMVSRWNWELPLTDFPQFQSFAPYYYDWLDHEYYDSYWAALDVETRYQNVKVPALNFGDWFDIFGVGTVRNYQGLRAKGGTWEARAGTELVMGAYGHPGDSGTPTFGNDTPDPNIALHFFDRYLKGINDGDAGLDHFYVLVPPNSGETGYGFWISASSYPLPGTKTVTYFLKSRGHANSRYGDGGLATSSASGAATDTFVYDPSHPVPTVGGAMCCNSVLVPEGARDQNAVERRNDVLVYTSDVLANDLAVIGTVNADFWAATSARDTDFTVKLVDLHPDGHSHNVLDRIVRARLRLGSKLPPSLIQPGKVYEYKLELGNTGTIFRAGHRVRVEISSSSFPHYARNLNTGLSNNDTSRMIVASQTILHDFSHPSFIALPVAPGVTIPAHTSAIRTYPSVFGQQTPF